MLTIQSTAPAKTEMPSCFISSKTQWKLAADTYSPFTCLECIRLHKLPKCAGPYYEQRPGVFVEDETLNIAASFSCCRYKRLRKKRRTKESKEEVRKELKEQEIMNSRWEYVPWMTLMKLFFSHLYPLFLKYVSQRPWEKDDWSFFLNRTVIDQKKQYNLVMEEIERFLNQTLRDMNTWITNNTVLDNIFELYLEITEAMFELKKELEEVEKGIDKDVYDRFKGKFTVEESTERYMIWKRLDKIMTDILIAIRNRVKEPRFHIYPLFSNDTPPSSHIKVFYDSDAPPQMKLDPWM